jgi:hypothetical protein
MIVRVYYSLHWVTFVWFVHSLCNWNIFGHQGWTLRRSSDGQDAQGVIQRMAMCELRILEACLEEKQEWIR